MSKEELSRSLRFETVISRPRATTDRMSWWLPKVSCLWPLATSATDLEPLLSRNRVSPVVAGLVQV
jgi:hypothetical protein